MTGRCPAEQIGLNPEEWVLAMVRKVSNEADRQCIGLVYGLGGSTVSMALLGIEMKLLRLARSHYSGILVFLLLTQLRR